jgi:hypothetical protein
MTCRWFERDSRVGQEGSCKRQLISEHDRCVAIAFRAVAHLHQLADAEKRETGRLLPIEELSHGVIARRGRAPIADDRPGQFGRDADTAFPQCSKRAVTFAVGQLDPRRRRSFSSVFEPHHIRGKITDIGASDGGDKRVVWFIRRQKVVPAVGEAQDCITHRSAH